MQEPPKLAEWPASAAEQIAALQALLATSPVTIEEVVVVLPDLVDLPIRKAEKPAWHGLEKVRPGGSRAALRAAQPTISFCPPKGALPRMSRLPGSA